LANFHFKAWGNNVFKFRRDKVWRSCNIRGLMTSSALHLNEQQQAAVHYTKGLLLVVAGAGSGKTRVIIEKMVYLVRERGLPAARIAAITFTNKAAREMKERLTRLRDDHPG